MAMTTNKILRLCSYNCRDIKSGKDYLIQLLGECGVCLLQEHWLLSSELGFLIDIYSKFTGYGYSAVDISNKILNDRPFGEFACFWRRDICCFVSVARSFRDDRICGIELKKNSKSLYALSVYLSTDYGDCQTYVSFLQCLETLNAFIEAHVGDDLCIVGDFNADPRRYSGFGVSLREFVEKCHLCIAVQLLSQSSSITLTYRSDNCSSTSWIDHMICTTSILNRIAKSNVIDESDNFSDHFSLIAYVETSVFQEETSFDSNDLNSESASFTQPLWKSVSSDDIRNYQVFSGSHLYI